jgi:hypothetical protein
MQQVARKRAADPRVRMLALEVLLHDGVPSHAYLQESASIGRFVRENVRYVRDINGVETIIDPLLLLAQIEAGKAQGDCDDMSLLIATMLLSIGHNPFFAIVKYRRFFGPYSHIYVVDYDRNYKGPVKRIVLDAILIGKGIGNEVKYRTIKEIRV